jgi:O-acetyl-ADP-ribose deacetylase (regulator of RNase III)
MPISFESGDIFATTELRGFAHGCNCAGAMGKGIAVAFKQRWPAMYEEYRRRCKAGSFTLGDVFVWEQGNDVVFNLGTQRSWTTRAELTAVQKALTGMVREAEQRGVNEIALPRIGAGLGGLAWDDVRAVLEQVANKSPVLLRVCDVFTAGKALSPTPDS